MKKYRDHYFKRAKADNYPARSVYKLKEIDKRFGLFKPGQRVLDLGAAPGSWTMYAAERVGPGGLVVAADLQAAEQGFGPNVRYFQEDVFEPSESFQAALEEAGSFHLVVSDMAPKTTGHKFTDQARSFNLCMQALYVARGCLLQGGHFVAKLFMGPDEAEFRDAMKASFQAVKTFKPKSSRSESKEIFYVGLAYKGQPSTSQAGEPVETE